MENWQIVEVEAEIEKVEPESRTGCGCLSSLLFVIVGLVAFRILFSIVVFLCGSK